MEETFVGTAAGKGFLNICLYLQWLSLAKKSDFTEKKHEAIYCKISAHKGGQLKREKSRSRYRLIPHPAKAKPPVPMRKSVWEVVLTELQPDQYVTCLFGKVNVSREEWCGNG